MRRLLALCVAACSSGPPPPSLGAPCTVSQLPVCGDASSALVCRGGLWAATPCAGGCREEGTRVVCAGAGDNCSAAAAPACMDSSNALFCVNFVWVAIACGGGCSGLDGGVSCSNAGGSCSGSGYLCGDSATALECTMSAWRPLPCRGPGGCARSGNTVTCDMNGSLEGDACASSAEGRGLCTVDGLGTLECRSGTLVKTNTCRMCREEMGQIICTP